MDESMNVGLQEELISDLTAELEGEATFNATVLKTKIVGAIREVKTARKYPAYYTDKQIQSDLYGFYSNIRNIALYDYNRLGAEFEKSHNENSVSRTYEDREKLFYGVLPLTRV
jgi:hypothetical protein